MKECGLLPETVMHYSRHALSVYAPSDPMLPLYMSENGFSSPAPYRKEERDIANWLWIGGAVLGVISGVYLLPGGIILLAIAFILERRREPRVNRIILHSAAAAFFFAAFMLLTTGLFQLLEHPQDSSGFLFWQLYAPCLAAPLLEGAAYCILAHRARRKARLAFLKKTDPGLSDEEIMALCGK